MKLSDKGSFEIKEGTFVDSNCFVVIMLIIMIQTRLMSNMFKNTTRDCFSIKSIMEITRAETFVNINDLLNINKKVSKRNKFKKKYNVF